MASTGTRTARSGPDRHFRKVAIRAAPCWPLHTCSPWSKGKLSSRPHGPRDVPSYDGWESGGARRDPLDSKRRTEIDRPECWRLGSRSVRRARADPPRRRLHPHRSHRHEAVRPPTARGPVDGHRHGAAALDDRRSHPSPLGPWANLNAPDGHCDTLRGDSFLKELINLGEDFCWSGNLGFWWSQM